MSDDRMFQAVLGEDGKAVATPASDQRCDRCGCAWVARSDFWLTARRVDGVWEWWCNRCAEGKHD